MTPEQFSQATRETWLRNCYYQSVYAKRGEKVILLIVAADTKEKYHEGLEKAGQEIAREMPGATTFGLTNLMVDDTGKMLLLVSHVNLAAKSAESELWRCVGRDLVLEKKGSQPAPHFDSLLKGYTMAMFGVARDTDCFVTEIKVQP